MPSMKNGVGNQPSQKSSKGPDGSYFGSTNRLCFDSIAILLAAIANDLTLWETNPRKVIL